MNTNNNVLITKLNPLHGVNGNAVAMSWTASSYAQAEQFVVDSIHKDFLSCIATSPQDFIENLMETVRRNREFINDNTAERLITLAFDAEYMDDDEETQMPSYMISILSFDAINTNGALIDVDSIGEWDYAADSLEDL